MVYCFDGSKEGFLTALCLAFLDENAKIVCENEQLELGSLPVAVETDLEKAQRVENRLLSFDRDCMHDLDILFRSGMDSRIQIAFDYFRLLAKYKAPIGKRLAEPAVFRAVECIKKVGHEIHKMHGFIRFMETASGALYAPFSPDNDIVDLLVPHFRARLGGIPFVIHDIARKKAVAYDGKNAFLAPLEKADILTSANENAWQELWKEYYRSVNIPARERLKQMKGYMPVRYWKFLPEKQVSPKDL